MKQNTNGQKGFTAALMVISMMAGTAMGTYIVYQVEHNKAGVLSEYINHEKYSKTEIYNLHHVNPVEFKAMVTACAVTGSPGARECANVHYVNTQLLGNS